MIIYKTPNTKPMKAETKEAIFLQLDDLTFLFNALVLALESDGKEYLLLDDPKTIIRKHAHKITDNIQHLKGFVEASN